MAQELVSRLIYRSRSVLLGKIGSVNSGAVQHILNSAQTKNAGLGITGVLFFDGVNFGQVLEGPKDAVQHAMDTILRDPRHVDVEILADDHDVARIFSDWSMSYVRIGGDTPAVVQLSATVDGNDGSWPVTPDQFALISFVRGSFIRASAA
jgi:hypothetical protein